MRQSNSPSLVAKQFAKPLWIPLVAVLFAWSITLLPFYSRLDLWLFDIQQQLASHEVYFHDALIVDIDEASVQKFEAYFGSWPYRRDTYGLLLDYLTEKGAKSVVFDMLFADNREGDTAFQAAIARNGNAVLAASAFNGPQTVASTKVNSSQIAALAWQKAPSLPALSWDATIFPNPLFAGSAEGKARVGIVSVFADSDGIFRRLPLMYKLDGYYLPSLAIAANYPNGKLPDVAYVQGHELRVGEFEWPIDRHGTVQLNFPRNANSVLVMSFSDVAGAILGLPGRDLAPSLFEGKTVFVGSAAYFADRVNTPYGLMNGIHVLAIANQTLKNGMVLRPQQWHWNTLLVLLAALPSLIIHARTRKSAWFAAAITLSAIAAIYALNVGLLAHFQQQSMLLFPLLVVALSYFLETISGLKIANKRQTAEIHSLLHQDRLTHLSNRFALQQHLDQVIHEIGSEKTGLAVILIDLDRFKIINDTLGNLVGDQLLVEVAERLHACVAPNDILARLGGDEFVVVVHDVNLEKEVEPLAKTITHALSQPYKVSGYELHTSPSMGISFYPAHGENADTLMRNADAAMYHEKFQGRNNYQFFTSEMNHVATERLELENSLHLALERNEIFLNYQPQVDSKTGNVVGMEALMRWMRPTSGLVMPNQFIPIAEETGLILPLGEWALRTACQQFRSWQEAGLTHIKLMAVNLSALQLQRGDLPALVASVLNETSMNAENLELEITESAAMKNPQQTIEVLNTLSEMGVRLAIDDFGTGHSSLNYLKLFPIHCLKLDGSFVRGIGSDSNDAAICDASITLAHNLGLDVVAEGVETARQYEYLKEHKCAKIQGYFFSKALSPDDAGAFTTLHSFAR